MGLKKNQLLDLISKFCYLKASTDNGNKPFLLTTGDVDQDYLDLFQAILSGSGHKLIGQVLFMELENMFGKRYNELPDAVAAVALGGCAMASTTALVASKRKNLHVIYVRKYPKQYGTQKAVEAPTRILKKGSRVVIFEDVISSGHSSLKAAKYLEQDGFKVEGVICIVDREEGGTEKIKHAGYKFCSLYTLNDILSNREKKQITTMEVAGNNDR